MPATMIWKTSATSNLTGAKRPLNAVFLSVFFLGLREIKTGKPAVGLPFHYYITFDEKNN